MRLIVLVFGCFLAASVTGCSFTYYYDTGRDFRMEDTKQIVKGKTTGAQLVTLFGDPETKTVKANTEQTWDYLHNVGATTTQQFIFISNTQKTGRLKHLSVELKNGIVTNYTITDSADGGGTAQ